MTVLHCLRCTCKYEFMSHGVATPWSARCGLRRQTEYQVKHFCDVLSKTVFLYVIYASKCITCKVSTSNYQFKVHSLAESLRRCNFMQNANIAKESISLRVSESQKYIQDNCGKILSGTNTCK